MKIKIITRHAVANYGSILQSYATERILKNKYEDVQIINYIRRDETGINIAKTMLNRNEKWSSSIFRRYIYMILKTPSYLFSFHKFKKFRKNLLNETILQYCSFDDLVKNKPEADIYISGSDQIWGRIGDDDFDPSYFLDFLNNDDRCISYASSFGKNEISEELQNKLPELLSKFSKILVREETAKKFLLEKNIISDVVLDPTLLLTPDDWNSMLPKGKNKYKDYIVVYQLHENDKLMNVVYDLAEKSNKKIVCISANIKVSIGKYKFLYLPDPFEFLKVIKEAAYIVTDSFHATVFSIIFNKNFGVCLPSSTSSRISDFLKKYGLENRIIDYIYPENNIKNYNEINKLIKKDRDNSITLLYEAVNINNIDMLNKNTNCTGCTTCMVICPYKAISMKDNEEGYKEPKIDYTKCKKCGICVVKCPQIARVADKKNLNTYAAYITEKNILNSSSGGIFYKISKNIIEGNGVVYGVAWNKDMVAEHVRIDTLEKLSSLQGSKYVQSDLKTVFTDVKKDLLNNYDVLFSGTPCQVAGLLSFLGRKFEKLITIDLVCHGVPSPLFFSKYIGWLNYKYKSKVINYSFRDKINNDWGVNARIEFNDRVKFVRAKIDPYFKPFTESINYRKVCYSCQYARKERVSNITLADYWGIEKVHKEFTNKKGVSLLMVNDDTGERLFNLIKNDIKYVVSDINKASKYNMNLNEPSKYTNKREHVYRNLKKLNSKHFKKYCVNNMNYKLNLIEFIKQVLPYKIRCKIKNLMVKQDE